MLEAVVSKYGSLDVVRSFLFLLYARPQ
jgi:hypothetical protein